MIQPTLFFNFFKLSSVLLGMITVLSITACQPQPPSERPAVAATPYIGSGSVSIGQQQFEHECAKCHRLQAGKNEKGPQLKRIYGAKAGLLTDYNYSDAMKHSQLTWTADNLDKLMTNPKQLVPNTKMKTDPLSDAQKRQDIIAYLATLK